MVDGLENKAMEIQAKFEFYFVALTFAILGFAITSASFGGGLIGDASEILGWASLLISGVKGLLRLRFIPVVLRYYAAKAIGQGVDEADLENVEGKVASQVYIWVFVAGLVFLAISRGIGPVSNILA